MKNSPQMFPIDCSNFLNFPTWSNNPRKLNQPLGYVPCLNGRVIMLLLFLLKMLTTKINKWTFGNWCMCSIPQSQIQSVAYISTQWIPTPTPSQSLSMPMPHWSYLVTAESEMHCQKTYPFSWGKVKKETRELMKEIILRFPTQTTNATFQDVNADQSKYFKVRTIYEVSHELHTH